MFNSKKKMSPGKYKSILIAAVVKRSGICRATVEQVLAATFDEIRFQMAEGAGCVPIESFGTFYTVDIPEREHWYSYKDKHELRHLPPTKRLKFKPTKSFKREVIDDQRFDPTRRSFERHPEDPPIKARMALKYQGGNGKTVHKGKTVYLKSDEG